MSPLFTCAAQIRQREKMSSDHNIRLHLFASHQNTMATRSCFLLLSIFITSRFGVVRTCLLLVNRCVTHCPRNMHPYHTRCDGVAVSRRTCDEPLIYSLGVKECPENMHRLNSECRPTPSQRTCDEPVAISMGIICDWSRCDCDFPFVLHPAYTGHCPLLKFRYGKCYGDNTRQILKEIRSKGLFNKPLEYRPGDNYELQNMPRRDIPKRDVYDGLQQRQPAYMTGYTGYVPGMNFRYGKSYGRAADDCMADFSDNQRELRRKADFNRSFIRSRSAPKMETVHSRDEIRRDLSRFREINKYKENSISPEFPPIAGYTGHIPRIKGSEASLSQRYHCAAKRGLELIRMERDKRKELQKADANVRIILKDHEKKYSYWNWG